MNTRSSGRIELLADSHRNLLVNLQKTVINKKRAFRVGHRILLFILFNGCEAEPGIFNQPPRCYQHCILRSWKGQQTGQCSTNHREQWRIPSDRTGFPWVTELPIKSMQAKLGQLTYILHEMCSGYVHGAQQCSVATLDAPLPCK